MKANLPATNEDPYVGNRAKDLPPASSRKTIVAAVFGNALEFFDFAIFSFFAPVIGKAFFPAHTESAQLLLALATFAVGFITRPLGGIVLGAYADRAGRKAAMLVSLLLMALGTGLIGLMPTYQQIGLAAPILVVAARLLQGFSAGGEAGAATVFLVESAPPSRRGFYGGWQLASQGLASLVGGASVAILSANLSVESLDAWGWRIPFLVGILAAPIGIYIRSRVNESKQERSHREADLSLFKEISEHHLTSIFSGILLSIGSTVGAYVLILFMITFGYHTLHLPMKDAQLAGVVAGIVGFFVSPFAGLCSDLFGRKRVMLWGRLVLLVATGPSFYVLTQHPTTPAFLCVVFVLNVMLSFGAVALTLIPEQFPEHIRGLSMAIVYNVAVAIFGGTTQFVVVWLIERLDTPLAPMWYLLVAGTVSTFGLLGMKESVPTTAGFNKV